MMVLVAHTLLMVALLLGVVRLLRGPTLADRIYGGPAFVWR